MKIAMGLVLSVIGALLLIAGGQIHLLVSIVGGILLLVGGLLVTWDIEEPPVGSDVHIHW